MNNKQLERFLQADHYFRNKGLEGYCTLVAIAMTFPSVDLNIILENGVIDEYKKEGSSVKHTYDLTANKSVDLLVSAISYSANHNKDKPLLSSLEIIYPNIDKQYSKHNNVEEILKLYPKGEYMMTSSRHIFSVKDGVVLDKPYPNKEDKVFYVIKINKTGDAHKLEDIKSNKELVNDNINISKINDIIEYFNYTQSDKFRDDVDFIFEAMKVIVGIGLFCINKKINTEVLQRINIYYKIKSDLGYTGEANIDKIKNLLISVDNTINIIDYFYSHNSDIVSINNVIDRFYTGKKDKGGNVVKGKNNPNPNPVAIGTLCSACEELPKDIFILDTKGEVVFTTAYNLKDKHYPMDKNNRDYAMDKRRISSLVLLYK